VVFKAVKGTQILTDLLDHSSITSATQTPDTSDGQRAPAAVKLRPYQLVGLGRPGIEGVETALLQCILKTTLSATSSGGEVDYFRRHGFNRAMTIFSNAVTSESYAALQSILGQAIRGTRGAEVPDLTVPVDVVGKHETLCNTMLDVSALLSGICIYEDVVGQPCNMMQCSPAEHSCYHPFLLACSCLPQLSVVPAVLRSDRGATEHATLLGRCVD